jgi:hypothetical protein
MSKLKFLLWAAFLLTGSNVFSQAEGKLRVRFLQEANGKPITLRDSSYTNAFDENYRISKLKYYAGQWQAGKNKIDQYMLVNAAEDENLMLIDLPAGNYDDLSFLLGVDSLRNCSGAQDGVLDPMNDMFWTWNTGYIMFKLEGSSDVSKADLNRLELHIGGFKGKLNVARTVSFDQPFEIREGKTTEIQIVMNLDKLWNGKNQVKIAEEPMCMTIGPLAQKIADNFPGLFSIRSVTQPQ